MDVVILVLDILRLLPILVQELSSPYPPNLKSRFKCIWIGLLFCREKVCWKYIFQPNSNSLSQQKYSENVSLSICRQWNYSFCFDLIIYNNLIGFKLLKEIGLTLLLKLINYLYSSFYLKKKTRLVLAISPKL